MTAFFLFFFISALLFLKKFYFTSKKPNLNNKHVLITGGEKGVGKATAIEALALGANVTVAGKEKEELKEVVEELKKLAKPQQKIQYLAVDLGKNPKETNEAIETAETFCGPVFWLVNCADVIGCEEFYNTDKTHFKFLMDSNFLNVVSPTLCLAEKMKKRKSGGVVFVTNQASFLGVYGMSGYCAAKFAVRGFAESLYWELKLHNVSVTIFLLPDAPGPDKSAPEATQKIWGATRFFEETEAARRLLSSAWEKKFMSWSGAEGAVLSFLCAGMSPVTSLVDFAFQVLLMSPLRLLFFGYLLRFRRIILTHKHL